MKKHLIHALAIVLGLSLLVEAQGTGFFARIGVSDTQIHTVPAVASDTFSLLAAVQTLTNKTVSLASNTISGTTTQFNTALSDNDFATLAGTETLTNKTINAEGTGNVISFADKVFLLGAACEAETTPQLLVSTINSGNNPVAACYTTGNMIRAVVDFPDHATLIAASLWNSVLPSDWTGAVDLRFFWFSSATTGSAVWEIATGCAGAGEDHGAAMNAIQSVTTATNGIANRLNVTTQTALTTTGCAAGETINIRIDRDPTDASDNLAATARVTGVELTIRRAM